MSAHTTEGWWIQDDNSLRFWGNHTNIQAHLNLYAYTNNFSSDSKTTIQRSVRSGFCDLDLRRFQRWWATGASPLAREWTEVDTSTPLIPDGVRGIDADPVSFSFYCWALRGEWSSWTCLFMMTSSTSTSSRSLCRKSDMKLDTDSYVMWPHSTICLHATHETREQRRRNSSRLYDAKNYRKSVYWGPIAMFQTLKLEWHLALFFNLRLSIT